MRIRHYLVFASAMLCAAPAAAISLAHQHALLLGSEVPSIAGEAKRARGSAPVRYRRGKRAQAKPAKRSNRLHTSKRVRRKHRRAA